MGTQEMSVEERARESAPIEDLETAPAAKAESAPAAATEFAPAAATEPQPEPASRSLFDAIEGVAFIEGDANVAQVGAIPPGRHRASPLTIAANLIKALPALVIGLFAASASLFGSLAMGGFAALGALGVIVLVLALCALAVYVSWRTHTWELAEDALVLRSGLIARNERRIPYQRIHSIDLQSSVVERLFGLAKVTFDTGSDAAAGNAIDSLRRADAEALKRAVFARRVLVGKQEAVRTGVAEGRGEDVEVPATGQPADGAVASAPAPGSAPATLSPDMAAALAGDDVDYEMRLSTKLHVLASVSGINMGAAVVSIIAVVAGAFEVADLFVDTESLIAQFVVSAVEGVVDAGSQGASLVAAWLIPRILLTLALYAVVAIVVSWVISVVLSYVKWGGFVLRKRGTRVEVSRGLLSRATNAVDLNRVQVVCVQQGLLRRALGYAAVVAHTVKAPAQGGDNTGTEEGVTLHPCIPVGEVDAFLAEVAPEFAGVYADSRTGLSKLPGAALRRTLLRGVYWTVVLAAVLAGCLYGLAPLSDAPAEMLLVAQVVCWTLFALCMVAMFVVRVLAWRIRRVGVREKLFVTVDGALSRKVASVPRTKIQSLSTHVSPFQRRAGVATLAARTACLTAVNDPALRDVAETDAEQALAWVRPRYDNVEQARAALAEAGLSDDL